MRSVSLATFVILFVLAASMAFAQGCATPQPPVATIQPEAGAGPCAQYGTPCGYGQPVSMTPQPAFYGAGVCPGMTASVQASLGAGPALTGLCGIDFDRAYIASMYQLHTNIAALATQGIEQTMDKNLKDLSGKIRYEQTRDNEVLAAEYRFMGLGTIPVDYSKVQGIVNTLSAFSGPAFDTQYALEMSTLLAQQRDAAVLAQTSSTNPRLRNQAAIVVRSSQDEINALQRWAASSGAAAGYGSGPYSGYGGGIFAPGGNVPIY